MIPNERDNLSPNAQECSPPFAKLVGKFDSHGSPSRARVTPVNFRNKSTSSSYPDLPLPGPAHYAARRALWLTPTKIPRRSPPSSSRQRLEHLLSEQGAVNSEEAWKNGIEKVWKGLVNCGRLKRSLPLSLVVGPDPRYSVTCSFLLLFKIKVIHAGWLRDPDTWPPGAVVPDSDQDPVVDQTEPSCPIDIHPSIHTSPNTTSQEEIVPHEINSSGLVTSAF